MREPIRWCLRLGERASVDLVGGSIRWASRGPSDENWTLPGWLLPHQVDAARRIAGSLATFGGALLADAVGLGKTYVALALATRYRRVAILAPAALVTQWQDVARRLGIAVTVLSDEALSRGASPPSADLLVVDEAHRFRNRETRRYDQLARRSPTADLLLLTATPVVNRASDLASLLALFLPDNALTVLGLPSLRAAVAGRDYDLVGRAAGVTIVARSPAVLDSTGSIPRVNDSSVAAPPPVPAEQLAPLLAMLEALEFPAFGDPTAAKLLGLHLRYRLASSVAALSETLDRHHSYLCRAIAAAQCGNRLSRRDAHLLFEPDDEAQLSLELHAQRGAAVLDAAALTRERDRIERVRQWLRERPVPSPKADHLARLLASREGHKTIVFSVAVATARDLARRLGWRRLAVVSGRGAWIASGPLPAEDALRLFAPRARSAPDPEPAAVVQTLLATDLASEGLNLQDADGVVHYDLPWTPLRLQQRLGRIARLGSAHSHVGVWWFAPPPSLESTLDLTRRIAHKSAHQLELGVPVSSRVGKAAVIGCAFESREHLARAASAPVRNTPVYCTVAGPAAAVFVVSWWINGHRVPEVLVVERGRPLEDVRRRTAVIDALLNSPPSQATPPPEYLGCLRGLVRSRLASLNRGPVDPQMVRLARRVARRAAAAARAREPALVALLDHLLNRIMEGVTEGERRRWEETLGARAGPRTRWPQLPRRSAIAGPSSVSLDAALFGVRS